MFEDAKPGDKVWSFTDGWGVVRNINTSYYPLDVMFEHRRETFTVEGKSLKTNKYPTLFWDEVKIEAIKKGE